MGLKTFCQEQSSGSEYAQVFHAGRVGGEWGMTDGFNKEHLPEVKGTKHLQNLRNAFVFCNSYLG